MPPSQLSPARSSSPSLNRRRSPSPKPPASPSNRNQTGPLLDESLDQGKLEQQLILRLPDSIAPDIREKIRTQSLPPDFVSIVPIDNRNAMFCIGERKYPGTLVDLPCIIESQKTFDQTAYYKSADICQMLIVREPGDDNIPDIEYPSGITPPTSNIRSRRFRKPQYTKEEIVKAESQLLSILEGGPQVHYELVEQEVDDEDEDEESGDESGDEWDEDDDDEEEEEDEEESNKWRQTSVRSDASEEQGRTPAKQTPSRSPWQFQRPTSEHIAMRSMTPSRPVTDTPSFTPSLSKRLTSASPSPSPALSLPRRNSPSRIVSASPSTAEATPVRASPAPPTIQPSVPSVPSTSRATPSLSPASPKPITQRPVHSRSSVVTQPAQAPAKAPAKASASASASASAPDSDSKSTLSHTPAQARVQAPAQTPSPTPTPDPAPSPAPTGENATSALSSSISPEEKMRRETQAILNEEIEELSKRVEQLESKIQTANKIFKKQFVKNLTEVQAELAKKKAALNAL